MLDAGYWMLDAGCWIQNIDSDLCQDRAPRIQYLVFKNWILDDAREKR
jgi:hypothetical protein